jgi:VWFA-related protein
MAHRGLLALIAFGVLGALTLSVAQQQPGQLPAQPGQLPPAKSPAAIPVPNAIPEPQGPLPPAEQPDDGAAKIKVDVLNILAPVTVTEKSTGKFVSGLTPLDFELYDNGRRQRIAEDVAAHPISLVIAIQANAGMEQILPNVRKIGSLLSGLVLGEFGEVAIVSFDHRITTMVNFTSDADKISEALKKIKPGSTSSRLNDAAMTSVNLLRNRPSTRRRILLLISESRDYGSEIHVRDVLTAMEFANVVTYTVDVSHLMTSLTSKAQPPRPNAIPPEARRQPDGSVATYSTDAQTNFGNWTPIVKEIFTQVKGVFIKNPLEVFTRYTGGREYSFFTQKALEQAISDIGEELHSQYLLTYSPNNQNEAGFHDIKVRVLRPDLEVRTRDGYYLAGGKPQ